MEKVAELICSTVEDRSIMTGILVKNGYTVGPGRIPRKSGKSYDYTLKIYREKAEGEKDISGVGVYRKRIGKSQYQS